MGDPLTGIFDRTSYMLAISAMIGMAIATWLVNAKDSPLEATLKAFGTCLNQGSFNVGERPKEKISQMVIGVFLIYNYMVAIMYCSVVVSLLMIRKEGKSIQTLDDLLRTEHEDVR